MSEHSADDKEGMVDRQGYLLSLEEAWQRSLSTWDDHHQSLFAFLCLYFSASRRGERRRKHCFFPVSTGMRWGRFGVGFNSTFLLLLWDQMPFLLLATGVLGWRISQWNSWRFAGARNDSVTLGGDVVGLGEHACTRSVPDGEFIMVWCAPDKVQILFYISSSENMKWTRWPCVASQKPQQSVPSQPCLSG